MAKRQVVTNSGSDDWEDIQVARNEYIDTLMREEFQLTGIGTIFRMGEQPTNITHKEICYSLHKLGSLGYADDYELLPPGWNSNMLYAPLTTELVAALVPHIIHTIERKVIAGTISIYSDTNRPLMYISHVLGWYNHTKLRGPKPEFNPMIKAQHMAVRLRQNAMLSCPLCNKQFIPPARLVTQQAKFWAWVRWLPSHGIEYHLYTRPNDFKRTKKESS